MLSRDRGEQSSRKGHSVTMPQGFTHAYYSILGLPMWYPAKYVLTTNAPSLHCSLHLKRVDGIWAPVYKGFVKGIDVKSYQSLLGQEWRHQGSWWSLRDTVLFYVLLTLSSSAAHISDPAGPNMWEIEAQKTKS